MKPLLGKIAVVSGASRGVGRGIALVLGEAGATVYVTARSDLIDETARSIDARGGKGIAVRCDHTRPEDVRRLADLAGRADILVNNAWGGYEVMDESFEAGFADQPFQERWRGMYENGLKTHFLTTAAFLPAMLSAGSGLVISTVAWNGGEYLGNLYYDVAKSAVIRFIHGLAFECRARGVAAIAIAPGFTRTERVRELVHDEATLATTESPEYAGRGILRLATDPNVMASSGRLFASGELAERYNFEDIDGRRVPVFKFSWSECASCSGSGFVNDDTCKTCRGKGRVTVLGG